MESKQNSQEEINKENEQEIKQKTQQKADKYIDLERRNFKE